MVITAWQDVPERRREASDLTAPIDDDVAHQYVALLIAHGAQVQPRENFTYEAKLPGGKTQERLSRNHCIHFPSGSIRYDGLVLGSSVSFRIVFPDGFELRGIDQLGLLDGSKTLLFFPQEP